MRDTKRILFLIIGILALLGGFIGLVLPLVPTVPFLLVAAYSFSRSSDRLHAWLLGHRVLGPQLKAWMEEGAIPCRSKLFATLVIAGSAGVMQLRVESLVLRAIAFSMLALVLVYLWTRPTPRSR